MATGSPRKNPLPPEMRQPGAEEAALEKALRGLKRRARTEAKARPANDVASTAMAPPQAARTLPTPASNTNATLAILMEQEAQERAREHVRAKLYIVKIPLAICSAILMWLVFVTLKR